MEAIFLHNEVDKRYWMHKRNYKIFTRCRWCGQWTTSPYCSNDCAVLWKQMCWKYPKYYIYIDPRQHWKDIFRIILKKVLEINNGHKVNTAKMLGISRKTIYNYLGA